MFVIKEVKSYVWPVEFHLPGAIPGKPDKHSFDAEFKLITQSDFKELVNREGITDAEACREILVGWKGVKDEQGNEIPFSEAMREKVVELPVVASAITKAFIESFTGAKRKN